MYILKKPWILLISVLSLSLIAVIIYKAPLVNSAQATNINNVQTQPNNSAQPTKPTNSPITSSITAPKSVSVVPQPATSTTPIINTVALPQPPAPSPTVVASPVVILSTLTGVVTYGPTVPVCTSGKPCSSPLQNTTIKVLDNKGNLVTTAQTDASGVYSVGLSAGSYQLVPVTNIGLGGMYQPIYSVMVGPGGTTTQYNIYIDTGIRSVTTAPVPIACTNSWPNASCIYE